jgi:hypothetical protein
MSLPSSRDKNNYTLGRRCVRRPSNNQAYQREKEVVQDRYPVHDTVRNPSQSVRIMDQRRITDCSFRT